MNPHRFLTFVIYAGIICGAIGHIGYLWPELTQKERAEICLKYGGGYRRPVLYRLLRRFMESSFALSEKSGGAFYFVEYQYFVSINKIILKKD